MPSLIEIEGVGSSLAAACVKKNYRTIAKIAAATPMELASVPGISEKSAPQIIASAKSLLPKPRIQKSTPRKKRRAVAPVKVVTKAITAKTKTKSTDKAKRKPDRKTSKKASAKSSEKEKKMSVSVGKDKIKKLKKKIKKLKDEKKKILTKESKKPKEEKARKSNKKSGKKK